VTIFEKGDDVHHPLRHGLASEREDRHVPAGPQQPRRASCGNLELHVFQDKPTGLNLNWRDGAPPYHDGGSCNRAMLSQGQKRTLYNEQQCLSRAKYDAVRGSYGDDSFARLDEAYRFNSCCLGGRCMCETRLGPTGLWTKPTVPGDDATGGGLWRERRCREEVKAAQQCEQSSWPVDFHNACGQRPVGVGRQAHCTACRYVFMQQFGFFEETGDQRKRPIGVRAELGDKSQNGGVSNSQTKPGEGEQLPGGSGIMLDYVPGNLTPQQEHPLGRSNVHQIQY
jgi:hypothetical protein